MNGNFKKIQHGGFCTREFLMNFSVAHPKIILKEDTVGRSSDHLNQAPVTMGCKAFCMLVYEILN